MKRNIPAALSLAFALGGIANAQTFTPPYSAPTDGGVPLSAAQASALLPSPCAAIPAPDTFTGTPGSLSPCTPRADAARATQVQPATTTTASDGSWAVTWAAAFATSPTYVHAELLTPSASNPYQCNILTKSTTGATGKCYQITATTLPSLATSLLGLVVTPFANPAAGLTVMVVGRQ